jgi:hypothetical protein
MESRFVCWDERYHSGESPVAPCGRKGLSRDCRPVGVYEQVAASRRVARLAGVQPLADKGSLYGCDKCFCLAILERLRVKRYRSGESPVAPCGRKGLSRDCRPVGVYDQVVASRRVAETCGVPAFCREPGRAVVCSKSPSFRRRGRFTAYYDKTSLWSAVGRSKPCLGGRTPPDMMERRRDDRCRHRSTFSVMVSVALGGYCKLLPTAPIVKKRTEEIL